MGLQDQMRRMRHSPFQEQADRLNQMLRGRYAYFGIAGNIRALRQVHRAVEWYWRRMLTSRSWKGKVWWKQFQQIKDQGTVPSTATQAASPLRGAACSSHNAVNQLLKSVVR